MTPQPHPASGAAAVASLISRWKASTRRPSASEAGGHSPPGGSDPSTSQIAARNAPSGPSRYGPHGSSGPASGTISSPSTRQRSRISTSACRGKPALWCASSSRITAGASDRASASPATRSAAWITVQAGETAASSLASSPARAFVRRDPQRPAQRRTVSTGDHHAAVAPRRQTAGSGRARPASCRCPPTRRLPSDTTSGERRRQACRARRHVATARPVDRRRGPRRCPATTPAARPPGPTAAPPAAGRRLTPVENPARVHRPSASAAAIRALHSGVWAGSSSGGTCSGDPSSIQRHRAGPRHDRAVPGAQAPAVSRRGRATARPAGR